MKTDISSSSITPAEQELNYVGLDSLLRSLIENDESLMAELPSEKISEILMFIQSAADEEGFDSRLHFLVDQISLPEPWERDNNHYINGGIRTEIHPLLPFFRALSRRESAEPHLNPCLLFSPDSITQY